MSGSSISSVLRLLEKGRKVLGGSEVPAGRAIVRVERQPLVLDPVTVLDQIKARKEGLKATSYLDLVPVEYREVVIDLARTAFPQKGQGRTLPEFTEDMALNWLAKKEIFRQVAEEFGFKARGGVGADYEGAILALTQNGSIVALTEPNVYGKRSILYGRIELREDSSVLPYSEGKIRYGACIGKRLATTEFNSSLLIALAAKYNAPKADVQRSVIVMTKSFATIDGHTIWRPKTSS